MKYKVILIGSPLEDTPVAEGIIKSLKLKNNLSVMTGIEKIAPS
jgi:hypothetical protein